LLYCQVGKDRQLDYDPCFLSWFSRGEFLLAGGSNKQCNIYSRDGVQLGVVGDLSSWVWSAEVRPDANCVVSIRVVVTATYVLLFVCLYACMYVCLVITMGQVLRWCENFQGTFMAPQ